MIHVPRTATAPDGLARPGRDGKSEAQRALDAAEALLGPTVPTVPDAIRAALEALDVEFAAYKKPDVKDALTGLFGPKCAYCESVYAGIQPMDVEHFRPKGAVVDETTQKSRKPGYYWLAADWDNLLPSCIDCNRRRTHVHAGGQEVSAGKADRFPLVDESARLVWHGADGDEGAMLLNPAVDVDIDVHLRFREDGTIEGLTDRGRISIEVYGLDRPSLVSDRAAVARILELRLDLLVNLTTARGLLQDQPPGQLRSALLLLVEEVIASLLVELRGMMVAGHPFAGMCRQLIHASGAPLADGGG